MDVNPNGLSEEEQSIMDDLVSAVGKFRNLPQTHPSDINEFCHSIHHLQGLLGCRILQRDYPQGWPTYKEKNL